MPEESGKVKIKVKVGDSEAEVEASLSNISAAIELIPEVIAKLPQASSELMLPSFGSRHEASTHRAQESAPAAVQSFSAPSSAPTVTVEKGDSLSDVISKFFSDSWGRSPRKLMEVREALQSYGLNYPKQSVAVALLRLAKGSRLRRFKGEGGEYVYTASTGAVRIEGPIQPASPHPDSQEASTALESGSEQEEQLDLDAPSTN